MYTDKVLKMFKNPKHVGKILKADAVGEVGNAACGDIMKIYLKLDENEKIVDAKFQTFGCAAAIVSTSVACDMIIGKTLDEALLVTNDDVLKQVGELPPQKIHCSILAQEAILDAVKNYRKKHKK